MEVEEPCVTVAVRIRPKLATTVNALQQNERYAALACVPTSDYTLLLEERRGGKTRRNTQFAYDHVFDTEATQEDVYEAGAIDAIDGVLTGRSASLLTYGQTGSGKTYTVLGVLPSTKAGEEAILGPDTGLLLRAIQDMLIFAGRMRERKERHVVLGITAVEIYKEEIRDLLRPGAFAAPLQAIMTSDALHFPHLTHAPLRSLRDACEVYAMARQRRVQRATSANDVSSRSHAVFTVEVFQIPCTTACVVAPPLAELTALRAAQRRSPASPASSTRASPTRGSPFDGAATILFSSKGMPVMYSALTVADLAGSEKAKHVDVDAAGFEELRRINASLTALGNVVHHLHAGTSHVPYRDSKLTMVLRDTFAAPRSRVVVFVNVSPTILTYEETLSSLYFADRMKAITAPAGTAVAPQVAALQQSYLTSLRLYDTLLAEMHIFEAEEELEEGQLLRRVAAITPDHPLFQLPYHTPLPEGPRKSARMQRLLANQRDALIAAVPREVRLQRETVVAGREMKQRLLGEYSQRRAEVQTSTSAMVKENGALQMELPATEAAMRVNLSALKADTVQLAAERQALRSSIAGRTEELDALAAALEEQIGDAEDTSEVQDVQDVEVPVERDNIVLRQALELAHLRLTMVEYMAYHVRTATDLLRPLDNASNSFSAPQRNRSSGGSDPASSISTPPAIDQWLRGAVVAMAGNAVTRSLRRLNATRPPVDTNNTTKGLGLRVLQDRTNTLTTGTRSDESLPKYWSVCLRAEQPPAAKKQRSSFDDPELLTRVTAYMDSGARLTKVDHSGRPHRRWFYLAKQEGRLLLCWDVARRSGAITGGGHVYLDAVEKITLGRSSPGFRTYTAVNTETEEEDVYSSFTVVYHTRARRRELKFVDVICPSRSEMETWVVGLAHWSGVSPIFEDAQQPDEVTETAPPTLEPSAALLCRRWHIPQETLIQSSREVEERRHRHTSGRMPLTPGQLRDLTDLDIFRASALWRYLESAGLVVNPTASLRSFVSAEETRGTGKEVTA